MKVCEATSRTKEYLIFLLVVNVGRSNSINANMFRCLEGESGAKHWATTSTETEQKASIGVLCIVLDVFEPVGPISDV